MTINDEVRRHLHEWKFGQAESALDEGATRWERDLVAALSACWGDGGWFGGDGLALIVGAAVELLTGKPHYLEI